MRYRKLIILSVITVAVIAAAVFSSYRHAPETAKKTHVLFPGLKDKVNDVSEVVIRNADSTLNLVRDGGTWTIKQADGYPALFDKIKPLILNVAGLEVLAQKTKTPSLYPRLGVEDVDAKGATSHLLILKDKAGKTLASLIVGKTQQTKSDSAVPGIYVRRPDSKQSLLVKGELPVSNRPEDWFETHLFNIDPQRIESIVITHPNGPEVHLSRAKGTDEFTLADIPAGKKAKSDVMLHRLGTVLEDTFAQNVASLKSFQFPDDHASATIHTFDGLVATTEAAKVDGRNYVSYHFDVDPSRIKPARDQAASADDKKGPGKITYGKDAKSGDKDAAADKDKAGDKGGAGDDDQPDVRKEAAKYNKQLDGWAYTLPDYKYELLSETMDSLTTAADKATDKGK